VAVSLPPLLVTVSATSGCSLEFRLCEGNVVSVHVTKAHGRSRSIAPLVLNLGTRWRRMVSHTPRPHFPQSGLNVLSTDRQTDRHTSILPVPRIVQTLKMDILKQILMKCVGLL
jgi:hypothetical protein